MTQVAQENKKHLIWRPTREKRIHCRKKSIPKHIKKSRKTVFSLDLAVVDFFSEGIEGWWVSWSK